MTKRYLREKDLLAVPFDKGNGICVMKRQTYISKLNDISNLEQFEKVTCTRKNGRGLCLKEEDRINSVLHEQLKSMGGQLPRLYGQAKVHKKNIPLRPVLSMPGSPYHKIAQKVTKWLSVVPESKLNSYTQKTVGSLKRTTLQSDEVIISFDVTSLYAHVLVKEAIQKAADRLYSGDVQLPSVDKETFTTLATISSTIFILSTHDGTYREINGLSMGSPPAPPLSNIWLSKYEPAIKDDAKLFERYMDDILRTTKESLIENKLSEINLLHPNLKYTLEVEQNGKLPFLDICIEHHENAVSSTWYWKPTDTGMILNFHAMAPKCYKRSVIQAFVYRIYRACSSWKKFHKSLIKAKDILKWNQKPPIFMNLLFWLQLKRLLNHAIRKLITMMETTKIHQQKLVNLQYRALPTDNFIKQLKRSKAPIQPVVTLRKQKTFLPSLKPNVKEEFSRHMITHFKEQSNQKKQTCQKAF